ncbi:hypothetical protein ACLMJK_002470 [Lecanora helva]
MSNPNTSRRYQASPFENDAFREYIDSLSEEKYDSLKESYYSSMPNSNCILFEYQVWLADHCLADFARSNTQTLPRNGLRPCCCKEWLTIWLNAEVQEAWVGQDFGIEQRPGPQRSGENVEQDVPVAEQRVMARSLIPDEYILKRENDFQRHECPNNSQRDHRADEGDEAEDTATMPAWGSATNARPPPVPSSRPSSPLDGVRAVNNHANHSPAYSRSSSPSSIHSRARPPSPADSVARARTRGRSLGSDNESDDESMTGAVGTRRRYHRSPSSNGSSRSRSRASSDGSSGSRSPSPIDPRNGQRH